MRNSSYVEEASVFSGSVFDFDDENKSIASKTLCSAIERSRSVDRSYRREELRGPLAVDAMRHHDVSSVDGRRVLERKRETPNSTASLGSRRTMDRKHHEILKKLRKEKEEMEHKSSMEREQRSMDHLDREMDQKDEKINKLQETIRGLKKEVVMEKDENERCSAALDDLKRKLHECKTKEADTQSALREVMKNVEHERNVREKEMQLASKVQGAEMLMLEEKMEEIRKDNSAKRDALQHEITEKTSIIDELKRDINQLRSKLDDCTRSKADSDKTLRSQIERLELRLDNETEAHNKKVTELNEMHQTAEKEWMDKLDHLEGRLEEQGVREAQWTDELSMTRLELENLRLFSSALESQNSYLKESVGDMQNLERDYDDLKQYKIDSDQTIDDLKKELEVAHKAKATLARQVQTMKDSDLKRDEHVKNIEDSLAKLGGEKQEYIAKIGVLQTELSQSRSECQDTKSALANANAQLLDAASTIEKSMKNERALAKRVGELESENMKLASALSSIDTKMKQEVEAFNVEMANKDRHLKGMSQASNELKVKLEELQRETNSYKDQAAKLPQLEVTIKDLTASLVQSEDKYSTLQSNLKATNVKLEESEQNYDQLDKKFRALQRVQLEMEQRERSYATNASKRECEQIDTINKLKKDKKEQVIRIEQLQEELAKTKREVAQTKDNHSRTKEQLRTALQSLDEMMKYIDGMKDESDEMIKALEGEAEGLMKR
jgi:chromosome segregation ATPase